MDAIYTKGEATGAEVLAGLPDPPGYSAVRAMLRILEEKGHLKHREEGGKYVYGPTTPRGQAAQMAFRRVLETFFGGSLESAVAAHLTDPRSRLSAEEMARLKSLIEQAGVSGE
jgi:predicted transcriptional regulator